MVMLFAPGELTNRSPFGAYTIMRGARRSAYVVSVNPAGTFGVVPSGRSTARLGFGLARPGAGSALARGCGTVVFCCAPSTVAASRIAARPINVFIVDLMQSLQRELTCQPCAAGPCCSLRRCFRSDPCRARDARRVAHPRASYTPWG